MENETVIVINEADLEEGFFRVGTSYPAVRDSLIRKLKSETPIPERVEKDEKGRKIWFDLKLPASRLSKIESLLKTPDKRPVIPTQKQKEALRAGRSKKNPATGR